MPEAKCPHCAELLPYEEHLGGRRVRCGTCERPFRLPDRQRREVRRDEPDERTPRERRPESHTESADRPRPLPKKRYRPAKGPPWGLLLKGGLPAIAFVLLFNLLALAVRATAPASGPTIPAGQWKTFTDADARFTVQVPGPVVREDAPNPPGTVFTSSAGSLVCVVAYMPKLQLHMRGLRASQILDENATQAANAGLGGSELQRTWISMAGKYPGRQVVVKTPANEGKRISRIYLVQNRVYAVTIAGPGIEPNSEVVRQVFDSFHVFER